MANEVIYTVGHSNIDIKKFINILKQNNIEVLIDVRSVPFSRYAPQFNKDNIKRELEESGIVYIFMGNVLGGKPQHIVYEKIREQEGYQKGISRLIEIAKANKIAVMCSEENPGKCHRHLLITQSLLWRGMSVLHIRGGGTVEVAGKHIPQATLLGY
ncbi:hypothetical protein BEH94_06195 [Candidatus Altiarchaeales archaeon WOR_SM1_SCG]|nr:hypothetical protein BEH94_06195 [Candidatus Altiarchaeales archaeon WOR_SM1_SCG]